MVLEDAPTLNSTGWTSRGLPRMQLDNVPGAAVIEPRRIAELRIPRVAAFGHASILTGHDLRVDDQMVAVLHIGFHQRPVLQQRRPPSL